MTVYKQLTKQVLSNRIFIILLAILCTLTAALFFFVRFTIDGNVNRLDEIIAMGGDGVRYRAAINSNTTLAYVFLAAIIALTAFVFFIFYYRFYRSNRKQIGVIKALGFKDSTLNKYFILLTAGFTFIGGLIGLLGAYPLSAVLLQANIDTYGVTGLVRSLNMKSILLCFIAAILAFSFISFISYRLFIKGKETGNLIAGNLNKTSYTGTLKVADKLAGILPVKNKFPVRIMLRKPITVLLIFAAVLFFNTFMIISYSLNISSSKVYESQTAGHNYEYLTTYDEYLTDSPQENDLEMLSITGTIQSKSAGIKQNITGLYRLNDIYEIKNKNGDLLSVPDSGTAVIGEGLREVYGLQIGDTVTIDINSKTLTIKIADIAENAKSDTVYVNGNELAALMGLESGSYNVLLSDTQPDFSGNTITQSERIDLLEQDATSNNVSGVINQVIGALSGCILLFLALYMSFQDNTRDMLILGLMGYQPKDVRKMFVDIYRPIIWIFFVICLPISIMMVQSIQRSLSVSTGDYMPFGTNILVIGLIFIILTLIYQMVQLIFGHMLKRIDRKEEVAAYTNVE